MICSSRLFGDLDGYQVAGVDPFRSCSYVTRRSGIRPIIRREGTGPVDEDRTLILVLNYNGRELLAQCLPSLTEATRRSEVPCRLAVIDNGSTDDSIHYLANEWPEIEIYTEPNRGLVSFNSVVAKCTEPIVLLLNNDVKLEPNAVGPLYDAIKANDDALFSAPLCWTFDGQEYEGMRTRVRTRYGLVQGMCRVPGFEAAAKRSDFTAAAGPVLAIHRTRFLALGGYDQLYFPGRIEDLDLGFRGWIAGWRGYYVPKSVAYHQGFGSFGPAFGADGCDRLAQRNTLLFAWKNLSGHRLLTHLSWLPPRLIRSLLTRKRGFALAFFEALGQLRATLASRRKQRVGRGDWYRRQETFFREFRW